jgi:hypothetical protein
MPKTWSNRPIEHIDLGGKKQGMPMQGYVIIGIAATALCVYTALAIDICMHPVQTPTDESAPINPPASSR